MKPDDCVGSKIKELEKQLKTYMSKVYYLVNKDPDGGPGKRKIKSDLVKKDLAKDKNGMG